MSTLTLSGWAQPADALLPLAPGAGVFDYSAYPSMDEALVALSREALRYTHCIAWSLGGLFALRAVMAGVLTLRHLTLIATAHQFVVSDTHHMAMGRETFALFRASYANDPARTKTRFHALVAKGEPDPKTLMAKLRHHPQVEETARWLPWLDLLAAHTFAGVDFSAGLANPPPTLIIHGMNDAIVPPTQAALLANAIAGARVEVWPDVGHAPHLHNSARLVDAIEAHRALHGVVA